MLVTTTNRLISKSVREFSTRKIGPEAVAGVAKVREQREKYFKNHTQGKLNIIPLNNRSFILMIVI